MAGPIHLSPRVCCAGLIVLHAVLLIWSARANSVAVDEFAHLPTGLSYWRSGHFSIYDQSPPLLRLIAAAPVVLANPSVPPVEVFERLPAKDRHWAYADAFLRANAERYASLFALGRMPMVLVSCLGAWIVYRWASALYGPAAALIPCAVYVLCPNLLAYASLVGTDSGTAVAMLLAAWLWWRFCRSRTKGAFIAAAIAIGIAHLCKFTALLLWPMVIGMSVCMVWQATNRDRRNMLMGLAFAAFATFLIVNLGYGFEGFGRRASEYTLQSRSMIGLFDHLPRSLPIPLPSALVEGFDAQRWEFEQGMASFLFGKQYAGSRWYYYPVALLFKTPLTTLILLVIALWRRRFTGDERALLVAAGVFLFAAMFLAGADLGIRYILPLFPLVFVLIGRFWRKWTFALLVVLMLETLWIAPRYLSFFNLLAGGSMRGQTILNDSNFDWGGGLIALRDWMRQNDVKKVHLGYFGRVDPAVYGIDYDLLTEKSGQPYVAISSHFLVGLSYRLPSPHGPSGWISLPFYRQLQAKPRVAVLAGGTIHVFNRDDVGQAMRAFQTGDTIDR